MAAIEHRYDFVLLFDVRDGNPNGDPDAGNLPRVDVESGNGIVTDVALKRKVRNYVGLVRDEQPPYDIYVKEHGLLSSVRAKAYVGIGQPAFVDKDQKVPVAVRDEARNWMCANFYDIRTFGAVMAMKTNNCGQVRGPVQITFGRSVEPIVSLEHSITRMAVETVAEAEKQEGDNRTMGRKATVPYGLYRAHGFVSAFLARQTGFSADDLRLLWEALASLFEHDRSAARGEMATRGLYVFEHASELGNAPAHALFDRLTVTRIGEGGGAARAFADYAVSFDSASLAIGQTLEAAPNIALTRLA